ncbi:hypothetical protein [Cerasicoccus frondis]|uniref:hypothetical protein n=1 Tax=Cerasicoccus frondis TaxID=490090 RepID=UPI0028525989|nr:hypothetical protein [Cerasicoccus frondis]
METINKTTIDLDKETVSTGSVAAKILGGIFMSAMSLILFASVALVLSPILFILALKFEIISFWPS